MCADFFRSTLQSLPLLLFFLAETSGFVADFLSRLVLRFFGQLPGFLCIFLQLIRQTGQRVHHFLRFFRHRLAALSRRIVFDSNCELLRPDFMRPRDRTLVRCPYSDRHHRAGFQSELFELQSEGVAGFLDSGCQFLSRKDSGNLVIKAIVQFKTTDSSVICDVRINCHDAIWFKGIAVMQSLDI